MLPYCVNDEASVCWTGFSCLNMGNVCDEYVIIDRCLSVFRALIVNRDNGWQRIVYYRIRSRGRQDVLQRGRKIRGYRGC